MLDDIADIAGMVEMTIIHNQAVPESGDGGNTAFRHSLMAAYAAQAAGDTERALLSFRAALALAPDDAEALCGYALQLHDTGEAAAATALKQALVLSPRRTDLLYAWAENCLARQTPQEAEPALRAALNGGLGQGRLTFALAELCAAQGNIAEAVVLGREALQLDKNLTAALPLYARWLVATGEHRLAIETLIRYLRENPEDTTVWRQLGHSWLAVQETEKARQAFARAGDAVDAISAPPAESLSVAYVRALFDGYADRFDTDLRAKLNYRAPELLAAAVSSCWPKPPVPCRMLDLGCGTGLAAQAFKLITNERIGIDCSPRMLAQAEKTGLYQQLIAGDIVAECRKLQPAFALITAADVLVYLGDLAPLFAAIRPLLAKGGVFAATVEEHHGTEDWLLQPQRRYAHSATYLRRLATAYDLQLRQLTECVPRTEKSQPVSGLLFLCQAAESK